MRIRPILESLGLIVAFLLMIPPVPSITPTLISASIAIPSAVLFFGSRLSVVLRGGLTWPLLLLETAGFVVAVRLFHSRINL